MLDSFYLAWKYIAYNRIKTAVLVACVTLIAFLPFALQLLLGESERRIHTAGYRRQGQRAGPGHEHALFRR